MRGVHVDIEQWVSDLVRSPEGSRKVAVLNALRGVHNGLFFTVTSRRPLGTNVFERDWDLLVVLDACRVDAVREVAPEFDFIETVGSVWSVGSSSHEWLCKTFTEEHLDEIRDTIYVTTNPNTLRTFEDGERPPGTYSIPLMWPDWGVVDVDDFESVDRVSNSDVTGYYTTTPDYVTDHAITAGRTREFGRMIVHYLQPHRPYIGRAYPEERPVNDIQDQPWDAIRGGAAPREEVWELYLDNLRIALRSVGRLLENFDAEKVVITADHGDLFGEFGEYGHPEGFLHPNLKKVPWIETTATDTETSDPSLDVEGEDPGIDVEDQLKHPGYI
jgi:hypothetical protein